MVGDQHHTAASHLDNYICGRYLWQQKYEELMKDFFFQKQKQKRGKKKLALPRKIFHWTERRCWQRKGQWTVAFFLDLLCSWGQRTPSWAWGFSLWPKASSVFVTVFKMIICRFLLWRLSDAERSPHPFSPQEEKHFYRNTARAIWAMLFPSPIPPLLSNVSKWYGYISLKAKSIWLFFPCWIEEYITILFVTWLHFVNSSAEIYLTTV